MTVVFVFAALLAANFLFSHWDDKRLQEAKRMEDFYRVEYKKCYGATVNTNWQYHA